MNAECIPTRFPIEFAKNCTLRFDVDIFYEDALGPCQGIGNHSMLLPHEVVAHFYWFPHADLKSRLTGGPGDSKPTYVFPVVV